MSVRQLWARWFGIPEGARIDGLGFANFYRRFISNYSKITVDTPDTQRYSVV